ncbi:MAG TPA: putative sugar nucleotidyl transferase [Bacteroidia bacterium]|nr:putative sugar nucleotidyl transferase [Bacteroidia bacterium]HNT80951.1 putative sugar nucleotidyl transferase [Bacteroidia bacterium]
MNVILQTTHSIHQQLKPFTFTRPASEIRCGILTIKEKWEQLGATKVSDACESYLSEKYPIQIEAENIIAPANLLLTQSLFTSISNLKPGQSLYQNEICIAIHLTQDGVGDYLKGKTIETEKIIFDSEQSIQFIERPWHIFQWNGQAIADDFLWLTADRKSDALSSSNRVRTTENVFVEEGAVVECSIINAALGPVYIGKGAEIMEGTSIRGPFALGDGAVLKMGAKIYGATTIGPQCKVGGEVNNSILFANSNKAHDGFIGNSVIGEWCNLGADTNTSNLKNNYSSVSLHDYSSGNLIDTQTIFCGMMMGDHSKAGINTMFNTGTCIDVCVNVFGADFPPKHVASFKWGGASGFDTYKFDKAIQTIRDVMSRRSVELSDAEYKMLKYLSEFEK